jgi:hypothetical protein
MDLTSSENSHNVTCSCTSASGSELTGAGGDNSIFHDKNPLRFPYVSIILRSSPPAPALTVLARRCSMKKCSGKPANVSHVEPCGSGTCEEGRCEATCSTGYSPSGDNNYSCTTSGSGNWEGGTLTCSPNPCNSTNTDPDHGTRGTCTNALLLSGGSCTPACDGGYVLISLRHCQLGNLSGGECHKCTNDMCAHIARGSTCVSNAPEDGYSCNCTAGWTGLHCTAKADECEASRPCSKIDPDAACLQDPKSDRGYICNCSSGYSSSAEDGANCNVHESRFTIWEVLCTIATVASVAPVPLMVVRFRRSLGRLHDPQLPEGKDAVGLFGIFMFVYGVADLALDIGLCFTLASCGQHVLLCCCLTTLAVTTTMTWYLGYSTLKGVVRADRREGSPSSSWLTKHPLIGPLIVLASSSRLNSMAILRLRICGRMLIDFPDSEDHRFFHFMRNAGLYHFWVEDIPHVLISMALLYAADDEGDQACTEHGHSKVIHLFDRPLELPFGDRDIAWASLFASVGSILFGLVSRMMLLLTVSVARKDESVRELSTIRTSMLDLVHSLQRRGHTSESLLDCVERDTAQLSSGLPGSKTKDEKTNDLLQLGSE